MLASPVKGVNVEVKNEGYWKFTEGVENDFMAIFTFMMRRVLPCEEASRKRIAPVAARRKERAD